MQPLHWYVYRLSRMSAAEVLYRLRQAARSTQDRLLNGYAAVVPAPRIVGGHSTFVHVSSEIDAQPYVAVADRILAGHYSLFHLDDVELGHPPDWNRDPLTGKRAPLIPAVSLDYRDQRLVGNIKYLWEPNRHLHLVTLAQAYRLTGEPRYAEAIRTHVDSWIAQCPPGRGANWTSSLELGIRLINWSIAWQLLGGFDAPLFTDADGQAFRDRWLTSVFRHARAIVRNLSQFSSANNHLIGETAGVYVASVTWNVWPQLRAWGLQCKEILEQEALIQNAEDGGNKEQAFAYQQFVLDFLLLAGLAARASGADFAPDYWQRIERMLEFLSSMMDVAGHVPMIGDADDGYVVRLVPDNGPGATDCGLRATGDGRQSDGRRAAGYGPQPKEGLARLASVATSQRSDTSYRANALSENYRSLLATGAILFERSDFARKAGRLDDKTRWLLAAEQLGKFEQLARSQGVAPLRRAFPQSGYYILGSAFETPEEVRMVVDAGPLGYLSIAAHGHADALSIVLNVGGEEVLVDPGTYAYHTEPAWRRYFRSTRAHNTVLVDDTDQSTQSGNFMWSRHATARCLYFGEQDNVQRFLGEHDGYGSLREPVKHQREILYDAGRRIFMITDTLIGEGRHEIGQLWHFSEHLAPILRDNEVVVTTARHRIRLVAKTPPAVVDRYLAGEPHEGGWVSRRFGDKVPATTVAWRYVANGGAVLRTDIYVEPLEPGL